MLTLTTGVKAQKLNTNIAILPLDAKGIDQNLADIVSDAMISELNKQESFNALERSKMNEILSEQGFQESGSCDTENCQVQMGQLLGIDEMITGSIGKFDGSYIINVRRINLGSGKIEGSSTQSVEGGISELVGILIPNMVTEVCATQSKVSESPSVLAPVPSQVLPIDSSAGPQVRSLPVQTGGHQEESLAPAKKIYGRDGYYTEITLGLGASSTRFDPSPDQSVKTKMGVQAGINIGYAFNPSFPMFVVFKNRTMKYNSDQVTSEIVQRFYGLGLHYYVNKSAFFIGAQIGVGDLTQTNTSEFVPSNFMTANQKRIALFYQRFNRGAQSTDLSTAINIGYEFNLDKTFKLGTLVALSNQRTKQNFINPIWLVGLQKAEEGLTYIDQSLSSAGSVNSELQLTTLSFELVLSWDSSL